MPGYRVPGGGTAFRRAGQILREHAQGRLPDRRPPPDPAALEAIDRLHAAMEDLITLLRSTQLHVALPAWIQEPFRAIGEDQVATVALAAPAPWTNICQFQVRASQYGVVRGFGQQLDLLGGFAGDVEFRLVMDDLPIHPYERIQVQLATILAPREVMIPVPPGGIVRLQAQNTSLLQAYNATGNIKGWIWPVSFQTAPGSFESTLTD